MSAVTLIESHTLFHNDADRFARLPARRKLSLQNRGKSVRNKPDIAYLLGADRTGLDLTIRSNHIPKPQIRGAPHQLRGQRLGPTGLE